MSGAAQRTAHIKPAGETTAEVTPLFRHRAVARSSHRLPGPVAVIAPPAFSHTLIAALLSVGLLAAALYLIEIPLRARAVGVLMPPGGILDIASSTHGRVSRIAVSEGDVVAQGQLLIELGLDQGSRSVPSLAASQLASLEHELEILASIQRENAVLQQTAASDVASRLATMSRRRALAIKEVDMSRQRLALLARRVKRLESLENQGGISADRLEQLRAEFLAAQREQISAQRGIVELDLEAQQLVSAGDRMAIDAVILDLEADTQRERLERQISKLSVEQSHRILAPRRGRVIRIGVRPGAVITAGHPLLALAAEGAEWEAWLYVSAHEAGLLQVGQAIELRLDAYPHQIFGTVAATVSSVTRLAVLPHEVRVPITIAGAVFEVRAKINRPIGGALNTDILPGIGASFTATIIKDRYRLYEWLLRSRSTMVGSGRG